MSFFEESKRRNVFLVGIAYAKTAWILIRALSVFLPVLETLKKVQASLSHLMTNGHPVALMRAWNDTPAPANGAAL